MRTSKEEVGVGCAFVGLLLVRLAFLVAVGYVVVHFIERYW